MPRPVDHLHLDPLGGIAGDMFIAAVLDAFPEYGDGVETAMRAAGLPADWQFSCIGHTDGQLTGRRIDIAHDGIGPAQPSGNYAAIVEMLAATGLDQTVRRRALHILELLAQAEAAVHGVPLANVHFHEIADWDSICDVVGAAWLIEALGAPTWSIDPLPRGGGTISTAHGVLPAPAPATVKLLTGFAIRDDGIMGERVTPTGAAIVRALAPGPNLPDGPLTLTAEGTGFGHRILPTPDGRPMSNILRLTAFTRPPSDVGPRSAGRVGVITFEIDDQSPEDLALGLDHLRARRDVLDVCQFAGVGKKGRMVIQIQVICADHAVNPITEACLAQTATLGVRWRLEDRRTLPRETLDRAGLRVKRAHRPGGDLTDKAEADDLARKTADYAGRRRARRAAEGDDDG